MTTYTVDAGRFIRKDGFAFVSICKEGRTKPVEADDFVRLAAAAPELLEVLKDTLALALVKWGNLDPDATKVFERAQAAINKAEGEAG